MVSRRGQCRIVAGRWGGRRINIANVKGLRPSPERVRETVFNWLQAELQDAQCLDPFAGTGIFGFEALSRGAKSVTMIEKHRTAFVQLQTNAETLGAIQGDLMYGSAFSLIPKLNGRFDGVFLDPPYHQNALSKCIPLLRKHDLLAPDAWIYLEHEASLDFQPAEFALEQRKQTNAGEVCGRLLTLTKAWFNPA